MQPVRGVRFLWPLLMLVWLAAACGNGSKTPNGGSSPFTAAGSPTPGATTGSAKGSTAVTNVVQGAGGLVFSPSRLSVTKGAKVLVSDESFFQHTFTIPGTGIDVLNDPGQFQTLIIDLQPGTYTFVCRFHQSQGMKGTLIVTG